MTQPDKSAEKSIGQQISEDYAWAVKSGVYRDLAQVIDWHIENEVSKARAPISLALCANAYIKAGEEEYYGDPNATDMARYFAKAVLDAAGVIYE